MLHSSPAPYLFTAVKEIISQLLLNLALRVAATVCECEKIEEAIKTLVFFQKEHQHKTLLQSEDLCQSEVLYSQQGLLVDHI